MSSPMLGYRADRKTVLSTGDRIYARIKADIVALRLLPNVMLDESRLAQQYGASRTPIREALRRLEQDGLIVTIPRRGSFVTVPTLADVMEIDQIRLMLEPIAARMAAANVDARALSAVEARLEGLANQEGTEAVRLEFLEADSALHDLVLTAAGNRHLRKIVLSLHDRISVVRLPSTANRLRTALEEQRQLIAALKAQDGAAAEEAMRRHVVAAHESRTRLVAAQTDATAEHE